MPPNVAIRTPSPAPPRAASGRAVARRRFLTALAMASLMIAAFAAGSRFAAATDRSAVATSQIQSMVLPMADEGVDDEVAEPEPVTAVVAQRSCHAAYLDCVPLDLFEDLDCEDLAITDVQLQDVAWDPYELDDDGDGIGCESS